nr:NADH dehydrogenase subunit 2 [Megymenum brevicorne]
MYKSSSLFFMMMICGTMITISSSNWISMWMGLELNMMSFIPLIYNKSNKSSEACMIYFLVQSLSSGVLMFSILMSKMWNIQEITLNWLMSISLLIKMGAAPFHMWFPEMMAKMSWLNCFILMTWQKLAPLFMMSNINKDMQLLMMTTLLSVVVGVVGGLNQTSLRKLMAYSSINHLGWMLPMTLSESWINYMWIYTVINLTVCLMFSKLNIMFINQVNSLSMSMAEKLMYMINMFSLGGLPPFLGFLAKLITIYELTHRGMYMLMFIMIMMSIITLFYYMRIMTSMLLSYQSINKWITTNNKMTLPLITLLINMMTPLAYMLTFI